MNEVDKIKLQLVIYRRLETVWDEDGLFLPLVGDKTISLMTDAALSVLLAVDDMREYIFREYVVKDDLK